MTLSLLVVVIYSVSFPFVIAFPSSINCNVVVLVLLCADLQSNNISPWVNYWSSGTFLLSTTYCNSTIQPTLECEESRVSLGLIHKVSQTQHTLAQVPKRGAGKPQNVNHRRFFNKTILLTNLYCSLMPASLLSTCCACGFCRFLHPASSQP